MVPYTTASAVMLPQAHGIPRATVALRAIKRGSVCRQGVRFVSGMRDRGCSNRARASGEGGEGGKGLGDKLKDDFRESVKRNIDKMDKYVSTNVDTERASSIDSLSDIENANLNAWTSPTFTAIGGIAIVGIMLIYIILILIPPSSGA